MSNISKKIISFFIGGALYFVIEIMTRGYSHYSMFICGGISYVLVGIIGRWILDNNRRPEIAIASVMLVGSMIITTMELFTGIIVNIVFDMRVWDYSNMDYNVMGQICPAFSILWALISLPCVYIDSVVRKYIFGEKIDYIKSNEKKKNINQT